MNEKLGIGRVELADPKFFDNPLITGVGQVWSWDDFKEALSNLLTADKKIAP